VETAQRPPILLLEDDEDIADTTADILQDLGYRITIARDAESALRALETEAFSLVLTDFLLGTPAESATIAQGVLDAAGSVPVGCMTGWRLPETLLEEYSFILKKPFGIEELIEAVGRVTVPQVEDEGISSVIRSYFDALNARDWRGLTKLCTDDVVYHLPGEDRLSTRIVGRDALEPHAELAFSGFPEAKFEIERVSWVLRGAVAHFRSTWRSASGARPSMSGAVLLVFKGDSISEIGVRMDTRRLRVLEAGAS